MDLSTPPPPPRPSALQPLFTGAGKVRFSGAANFEIFYLWFAGSSSQALQLAADSCSVPCALVVTTLTRIYQVYPDCLLCPHSSLRVHQQP